MSRDEEPETGRLAGMGLPAQPPKPGMAMSISVLVVGLAIVGVGAYLHVADSAALDNSVKVTAKVTDVGVERVEASRGPDAFVPVVTFRYQYRGNGYTSDRLYPGRSQPRYGDRVTAESKLSEYAVGQRVTAFVDPEMPRQGFLVDSRSGLPTGALFVGTAIALIGGIGLYQARAQARARDLLS